jgi:hypothetical protein
VPKRLHEFGMPTVRPIPSADHYLFHKLCAVYWWALFRAMGNAAYFREQGSQYTDCWKETPVSASNQADVPELTRSSGSRGEWLPQRLQRQTAETNCWTARSSISSHGAGATIESGLTARFASDHRSVLRSYAMEGPIEETQRAA